MLDRRSPVAPLAIILPRPNIPRRRSSLLSVATHSTSPRTPRSSGSCPTAFFLAPAPNRNSTDSWNSSNNDLDDQEREWKPEQSLLLSRTLDALPAHLITPFSGVPPPNLLDKIARGISQAKGPVEWPHSLRQTRVKLLELARNRAKEEAAARKTRRPMVLEEDVHDASSAEPSANRHKRAAPGSENKRPLYRQSSMDFMNASNSDIADSDKIARLSKRLQRTDRIISPAYHPYQNALRQRENRSPSPSRLLNPSTASSSTLNSSCSSLMSHNLTSRRSMSTLATSDPSKSDSSTGSSPASSWSKASRGPPATPGPEPMAGRTITRQKRSMSYSAPKRAHKRAPSFGVQAQEARKSGMDVDGASGHSSDEEEKKRASQAKKPRTKARVTSPPPTPLPAQNVVPKTPREAQSPKIRKVLKPTSTSATPGQEPQKPRQPIATTSKSKTIGATSKQTIPKPTKPKRNPQRNPSMFGPELPHVSPPSPRSAARLAVVTAAPTVLGAAYNYDDNDSSPPTQPSSPMSPTTSPRAFLASPCSPASPSASPTAQLRTLRRIKRVDLGLGAGRRISFGSLVKCEEEQQTKDSARRHASPPATADVSSSGLLGSAFQLA